MVFFLPNDSLMVLPSASTDLLTLQIHRTSLVWLSNTVLNDLGIGNQLDNQQQHF